MRKDRQDELLEIIGRAEVARFQVGAGLCGALQHQNTARAYTQRQLLRIPGSFHDVERVVAQTVIHAHLLHGGLHHFHFARFHYRSHFGGGIASAGMLLHDFALAVA